MASFVRAFLDAAIDDEKTVTGADGAAATATIYGSARSSRVLVAVPAVVVVVGIAMVAALVFAEGVRFRSNLLIRSIAPSFRQRCWVISSWIEFQGSSLWHFVLLLLLFCFNPLALFFLMFERSTQLCRMRK